MKHCHIFSIPVTCCTSAEQVFLQALSLSENNRLLLQARIGLFKVDSSDSIHSDGGTPRSPAERALVQQLKSGRKQRNGLEIPNA